MVPHCLGPQEMDACVDHGQFDVLTACSVGSPNQCSAHGLGDVEGRDLVAHDGGHQMRDTVLVDLHHRVTRDCLHDGVKCRAV